MTLDAGGRFAVGNYPYNNVRVSAWSLGLDYAFYADGSAGGTGNWINASDKRWKRNVETVNGALRSIMTLRGVTFDWRRDEFPEKSFPEGRQIGFIAQEVQEVLPELVTKTPDGYLGVAYGNLVPVLVEAMKEQQKQIDELKAMVKSLAAEKNNTGNKSMGEMR